MLFIRKRNNYKQQDIQQALEMVRRGVSVRHAAKIHGIPQSTLRETKIEKWAFSVARAGFPVTRTQLRVSVAQYLKRSKKETPFKNGVPAKKWMLLFLKRHPNIRICKPSTMARSRATVKRRMFKIAKMAIRLPSVATSCRRTKGGKTHRDTEKKVR